MEGNLTIYGSDHGEPGFVEIEGKDARIESWTTTQIISKITKEITEKVGKKRLVVHDLNGKFDETRWTVES